MKFIGKAMPTVAAVAVSSVLAAGGGAFAATTLVQSKDIAPNAVTNSKIADGAVTQAKMSQFTRDELAATKTNAKAITALNQGGAQLIQQVAGLAANQFSGNYSDLAGKPDLSGFALESELPDLSDYAKKADLPDVSGLESKSDESNDIKALQDDVAALQAQVNRLNSNVNWDLGRGGWWSPLSNGVTSGNSAVLTEADTDASGANIENDQVNLPYTKGQRVTFTYALADGAVAGQGAPRVIVHFQGDDDNTWYSTINDVNPDYGTDNGDGTFTESIVPDLMNDNKVTPAQDGVIDRVAVVYDNTSAPGQLTATDLKVGSHAIPFN